MKSFIALTCAILATFDLASAIPAPSDAVADSGSVSVSYDPVYDVSASSTDTVACGSQLDTQYSTFGSLPGFPRIGGALTIPDGTSSNCGKCYSLHYAGNGVDETINVLAIDTAPGGFNIGLQAMNQLTDGQAEKLGRVTATYTEVDISECA
ncbi:Heat-stable 19 kDa antigen [Penicillium macrosclerotiorum]|uniref:Heat-stable 19 kDa antigen n=1 Tax=Penicillium macrosclerotiorum TaxID=303699 RepID=UPI002546BC8E|nr:Heat-stable 19 kDa antigen [Penicillium macrosclerotiorum]KAJ5666650.1 Heat-stable 19 kDa antigen [Penicillium macrosclerotiorum]